MSTQLVKTGLDSSKLFNTKIESHPCNAIIHPNDKRLKSVDNLNVVSPDLRIDNKDGDIITTISNSFRKEETFEGAKFYNDENEKQIRNAIIESPPSPDLFDVTEDFCEKEICPLSPGVATKANLLHGNRNHNEKSIPDTETTRIKSSNLDTRDKSSEKRGLVRRYSKSRSKNVKRNLRKSTVKGFDDGNLIAHEINDNDNNSFETCGNAEFQVKQVYF